MKHFTGCDLPFLDPQESGAPGDFAQLTTEAEVLEAVRRDLGDTAADALVASLAATATEPETKSAEAADLPERGPGDTLN